MMILLLNELNEVCYQKKKTRVCLRYKALNDKKYGDSAYGRVLIIIFFSFHLIKLINFYPRSLVAGTLAHTSSCLSIEFRLYMRERVCCKKEKIVTVNLFFSTSYVYLIFFFSLLFHFVPFF